MILLLEVGWVCHDSKIRGRNEATLPLHFEPQAYGKNTL